MTGINDNFYLPLWNRYLPVIFLLIKNARGGERTLAMFKNEFDLYANRKTARYQFNMEIENGKIANKITGSNTARDLFTALTAHEKARELLKQHHFQFILDKDFKLIIREIIDTPELADGSSEASGSAQ